MSSGTMSILMLIALFLIMYLLLIRPQRKREKVITDMRSSIEVGDRVVTIGGIIGKVVKTSEETLVVQLGDKNKIEIYRWGISKNITADEEKEAEKAERSSKDEEEAPKKSSRPKKMKKSEDNTEPAEEAPAAEPEEVVPEEAEEAAPEKTAEEE